MLLLELNWGCIYCSLLFDTKMDKVLCFVSMIQDCQILHTDFVSDHSKDNAKSNCLYIPL